MALTDRHGSDLVKVQFSRYNREPPPKKKNTIWNKILIELEVLYFEFKRKICQVLTIFVKKRL